MVTDSIHKQLLAIVPDRHGIQANLARVIGKDPSTVSRYLNNEADPSLEALEKMVEAVGGEIILRPKRKMSPEIAALLRRIEDAIADIDPALAAAHVNTIEMSAKVRRR